MKTMIKMKSNLVNLLLTPRDLWNVTEYSWWGHQMETFSVLLALCAGNSLVTGEFPSQRPVTQGFDVFFVCVWTNGWVNNRDAGDLRRHHTHYNVIILIAMLKKCWHLQNVMVSGTHGLPSGLNHKFLELLNYCSLATHAMEFDHDCFR